MVVLYMLVNNSPNKICVIIHKIGSGRDLQFHISLKLFETVPRGSFSIYVKGVTTYSLPDQESFARVGPILITYCFLNSTEISAHRCQVGFFRGRVGGGPAPF